MRTNFETIVLERRDNGILLVTLNRPEASNALNTQMGLDLVDLFVGQHGEHHHSANIIGKFQSPLLLVHFLGF